MSKEIEIGEYVRDSDGYIIEILSKLGRNYVIKQHKAGIYEITPKQLLKFMTKHSKNIIELIEKDDWVNGQHVKEVKNGYVMVGNGIDGFQVWEEDIRTIVTKEQFKSVEYEVE